MCSVAVVELEIRVIDEGCGGCMTRGGSDKAYRRGLTERLLEEDRPQLALNPATAVRAHDMWMPQF